jgi:catechol 2,3-dioxygenase-like lactoylglutathione lyase family enzyme
MRSMPDLRVCLDVPDMERALAFYAGALGFSVGRRMADDFVELTGGPCPLDLIAAKPGSQATPTAAATRDYQRHWTPLHFDLVVSDLDAALARALAGGALLERGPLDRPYGRLAVLSDPFGHGFCFLQFRGRGYDELLSP